MNSHWLRTFGMAVVGSVALAVTALAADPVFLGYGNSPQWSPSGELIGAWRGDTLVVFDVAAKEEIRAIPARQPKFFYWLNEDSIALSYQGRTRAAIPRDRETIVARAVLDLDGHFNLIDSDTLKDERNYITHWRKLPNGKVGAFELRDGVPTKFLVPGGDGFAETDPDTSARSSCWQSVPSSVSAYYPSPDCSRALGYSTTDEALLFDGSGHLLHSLGSRVIPLEGGKFTGISRPVWSSHGGYLAYTKYTEDGHYLYSTEIVVVDMKDYESDVIAEVRGEEYLDCTWSPTRSLLAIGEHGRISVWQPEY